MSSSSNNTFPSQTILASHVPVDDMPVNDIWTSVSIACIILGLLFPISLLQSRKTDTRSKLRRSLPCVGIKNQFLPWTRAMLRSISGTEAMIAEGYAKVRTSTVTLQEIEGLK